MLETLYRSCAAPDARLAQGLVTTSEPHGGSQTVLDFARSGLGSGQLRTFIGKDSLVNIADLVTNRPLRTLTEVTEDVLLVRANIGSACTYTPPGDTGWRFVRPEVTLSFLPRGAKVDVVIEPDTLHMAVTMLVRTSALLERYGLLREDLPAPLAQAMDGGMSKATPLFATPIVPAIASLVEDLLQSRLAPHLRALQVNARGLELMVLVVAAWKERLAVDGAPAIRGRDVYLIAAASRILTQRLVDPPTLQELAQELGTNRNKLNQIFQRNLGVTPRAFCSQRRIERAQVLLREGRLSVSQIAETVGYQHQSSFAAAFRDRVGMSPTDYGNARHATA